MVNVGKGAISHVLFDVSCDIKVYFMLECSLIAAFRWRIIFFDFALLPKLHPELFRTFLPSLFLKMVSIETGLVCCCPGWGCQFHILKGKRNINHGNIQKPIAFNGTAVQTIDYLFTFLQTKYVKHAIHIFHLKQNPAGYHSGSVVGQGFNYTGMIKLPWQALILQMTKLDFTSEVDASPVHWFPVQTAQFITSGTDLITPPREDANPHFLVLWCSYSSDHRQWPPN